MNNNVEKVIEELAKTEKYGELIGVAFECLKKTEYWDEIEKFIETEIKKGD